MEAYEQYFVVLHTEQARDAFSPQVVQGPLVMGRILGLQDRGAILKGIECRFVEWFSVEWLIVPIMIMNGCHTMSRSPQTTHHRLRQTTVPKSPYVHHSRSSRLSKRRRSKLRSSRQTNRSSPPGVRPRKLDRNKMTISSRHLAEVSPTDGSQLQYRDQQALQLMRVCLISILVRSFDRN